MERQSHLLPLSARTPEALRDLARNYAGYLSRTSCNITDIAYTAGVGRAHFHHRLAVLGPSLEEIGQGLEAYLQGEKNPRWIEGEGQAAKGPIAFLFTWAGFAVCGYGARPL